MLGRVKHLGQLAQVKSRSVYFRSSGRIPDEASPAGNYSQTRFGEIEELRPRINLASKTTPLPQSMSEEKSTVGSDIFHLNPARKSLGPRGSGPIELRDRSFLYVSDRTCQSVAGNR
jgi:hypothetical protein